MAANVLNSPQAVAMSVYVVRAFVHIREHLVANAAILKRLAEIDRTLLQHDSSLRDIYHKLLPLLQPPPGPPLMPKRRIGFQLGRRVMSFLALDSRPSTLDPPSPRRRTPAFR